MTGERCYDCGHNTEQCNREAHEAEARIAALERENAELRTDRNEWERQANNNGREATEYRTASDYFMQKATDLEKIANDWRDGVLRGRHPTDQLDFLLITVEDQLKDLQKARAAAKRGG